MNFGTFCSIFYLRMLSFPTEVIVHIFSFVDLKTLLLGVQTTCHAFRDITLEHSGKMQKHVKKSEEKILVSITKVTSREVVTDIFGNKEETENTRTSVGEELKGTNVKKTRFLKGKKHGFYDEENYNAVCGTYRARELWNNGFILSRQYRSYSGVLYVRSYSKGCTDPFSSSHVFYGVGEKTNSKGEKFAVFIRQGLDPCVYSYCCRQHQGILPDRLF
ncbi:hypothetical protein [Brazilian marseillevirus]|uniref:hypothetical protein n=1 Tax=Brazilian marseillevirus TaxID=1813599 RepID=UPI0007807030|nr:hypothetical protein A3303_gp060 [Brazilian marseillevirus]AMQ10568.1 hypothetical protein [Brazilian marseillevirus]